jgi:hypothetical protein
MSMSAALESLASSARYSRGTRTGGLLLRAIVSHPASLQEVNKHTALEIARVGASLAKLMDAHQQGALTLQRLRQGNRQRFDVVYSHQQVNVAPGGQAVIAQETPKRKNGGGGQG